MLFFVTRELEHEDPARDSVHEHYHLRIPRHAVRRRRLFLVDARRAQFDEAFYGSLARRGRHRHCRDVGLQQATDGIFRDQGAVLACRRGAILSLPNIGLFFGLHHWTEETFGFGARTIAVIDAAADRPSRSSA